MDFSLYLKESMNGALNSIFTMAIIMIPLMIIMELLKSYNILQIISNKMEPISRFFGISNKAIFPLMIGLFFGLSYGAGVIIESAEEEDISKKDLYILMIFLIACHAVVEDTLLFVVIGANLWLLLGLRVGVAIIITLFASRILNQKSLKGNLENTYK